MSSILKALKKVEDEKTVRLPDSLNIDADILKGADSPRSYSPFTLALMFLLVFGGGAAVAYFFMNDTKSAPTATNPPPVTTAKSPPAQTPPPVIEPEVVPAEIVVVPARKVTSGDTSRQQQQKTAAAGKADKITKKTVNAAVSGVSKRPKEADEALRSDPPASVAAPSLRVNGIAFQNSSADSMAIVNGMPVSSGSIVDGFTVEEVRDDRVLFQRNGERLEILLGQSNR